MHTGIGATHSPGVFQLHLNRACFLHQDLKGRKKKSQGQQVGVKVGLDLIHNKQRQSRKKDFYLEWGNTEQGTHRERPRPCLLLKAGDFKVLWGGSSSPNLGLVSLRKDREGTEFTNLGSGLELVNQQGSPAGGDKGPPSPHFKLPGPL